MFRSLFSLSLSVEICCGGSFTLFVDDRGDTYSTGIVGLPSLRSKFEHKTDEGEEEGGEGREGEQEDERRRRRRSLKEKEQ